MHCEAGRFRASLPVMMTVEEARPEAAEMVTLFCRRPDAPGARADGLDLDAMQPGQFFMVWIPRLDEKPYTLSYIEGGRVGISVRQRGPFSGRLCALRPGDSIGLRGPFGRPFRGLARWSGSRRVALIGGGCGMATMALLAERLPDAEIVQGARSAQFVAYRDRFPEQAIFTDDGSAGCRGFPTQWLEERARAGSVDMVYTCGPEVMMAAVVAVCRREGIACQVSMERYMKCGIGVCGQCECDGRRVCVEGPTFDLADLSAMPGFGRVRRDKTGRALPVGPEDACPAGPREDCEETG